MLSMFEGTSAQCTHKNLMGMCSAHISSWCACAVQAEQTHKFTNIFNNFKSTLKGKPFKNSLLTLTNGLKRYPKHILYGQTKKKVSLKLGWAYEALNICLKIFYFNPKVVHPRRIYGVKIVTYERSKISHLGAFKQWSRLETTVDKRQGFLYHTPHTFPLFLSSYSNIYIRFHTLLKRSKCGENSPCRMIRMYTTIVK